MNLENWQIKVDVHNKQVNDLVEDRTALKESMSEYLKQFFDFDETDPVFEEEATYEFYDNYGEDGELVFNLTKPFAYTPGHGLLVTVIMDALDDDNCLDSSFDLQFYSAGVRGRAMTFTNNTVSFLDYKDSEDFPDAKSTLGCGTNIDLPVTRIAYTHVMGQGLDCDVNGDGMVDVDDINIIINVILEKDTNSAADVDHSGGVDVADVNIVINEVLAQ